MMRFASVAATCALSACVMPLADERELLESYIGSRMVGHSGGAFGADVGGSPSAQAHVASGADSDVDVRGRAARHAQLSLAYLRHNRADVAHMEALAAWRLVPDDVGIMHLLALSEAALGRSNAALRLFAQAVKLDDSRSLERSSTAEASGGVVSGVEKGVPEAAALRGSQGEKRYKLTSGRREHSLSGAQDAVKELSERAILWSNYAVALEAAGQSDRAAHFSGRVEQSRRDSAFERRPYLE